LSGVRQQNEKRRIFPAAFAKIGNCANQSEGQVFLKSGDLLEGFKSSIFLPYNLIIAESLSTVASSVDVPIDVPVYFISGVSYFAIARRLRGKPSSLRFNWI
jgi:hypothetical protein